VTTNFTAEELARELGGRRSGSGRWTARCPAHQDKTPSLSIREADGRLLVHFHAGCAQSDVVAALKSRSLWPESDWTPTQKRDFAKQRARDEADLNLARSFADAAHILAEQTIEEMSPFDPERAALRRLLAALQTDTGILLEFRVWRSAQPKMTRALVAAGRKHQERLEMLVSNYLTVLEDRDAA
jgi:hypothetical protein